MAASSSKDSSHSKVCTATKEELLATNQTFTVHTACPLCKELGTQLKIGLHRSGNAPASGFATALPYKKTAEDILGAVERHGSEIHGVPSRGSAKHARVPYLKSAGLADCRMVYVGKKVRRLLRRLSDSVNLQRERLRNAVRNAAGFFVRKRRRIFVRGPPGVGKSTTTWWFALLQAQEPQSAPILWAHRDPKNTDFLVVILHSRRWFQLGLVKPAELAAAMEFDCWGLTVLDGMTASLDDARVWGGGQGPVLITSSTALPVDPIQNEPCYISVMSWTFEEYLAACTGDEFWATVKGCVTSSPVATVASQSVDDDVAMLDAAAGSSSHPPSSSSTIDEPMVQQPDNKELVANAAGSSSHPPSSSSTSDEPMVQQPDNKEMVEREHDLRRKYYFVGGCARWMFAYKLDEAVEVLRNCVEQVEDSIALLGLSGGAANQSYVSHLLAWYPRKAEPQLQDHAPATFVVSAFALKLLRNKAGDGRRFIRRGITIARALGNRSFLGWVYELQFLTYLTELKMPTLDVTVTQKEELPAPKMVQCEQKERWNIAAVHEWNGQSLPPEAVEDYRWITPPEFNQGLYDFAQVLPYSPRDLPTKVNRQTRYRTSQDSALTGAKRRRAATSTAPMPCTVRFINLTVGKTHDLKWPHAIPLLESIREHRTVSSVFIDIVVSDASYFERGYHRDRSMVTGVQHLPYQRVVCLPLESEQPSY